ncbi:MAG: ABC transporter ATP-binding protein [Spirochaetales bacterium]
MLAVDIGLTLPDFSLETAFTMEDEVLSLLGPSGAGKTLTIAAIAGLIRPDFGTIRLDSAVWFDSRTWLSPQKRRVGLVFQDYALFPHMNVRENLEFGLFKVDAATRARRVRSLLRDMQLDGLDAKYPGELSGGQKQRVALARALAPQPRILLLDEPFSAVDATVRVQLMSLVREIHARHGIPIILITHAIEEAYALSDRMAVIERGRVLQIGAREDVFHRPASREVARIVGTRNVLEGTVVRDGGGTRLCTSAGLALETYSNHPAGSRVVACIRPSRIRLCLPETPADSDELTLRARVDRVLGVGDRFELVAEPLPEGDRLEVEASIEAFSRLQPKRGDIVELAVSKAGIHTFEL